MFLLPARKRLARIVISRPDSEFVVYQAVSRSPLGHQVICRTMVVFKEGNAGAAIGLSYINNGRFENCLGIFLPNIFLLVYLHTIIGR